MFSLTVLCGFLPVLWFLTPSKTMNPVCALDSLSQTRNLPLGAQLLLVSCRCGSDCGNVILQLCTVPVLWLFYPDIKSAQPRQSGISVVQMQPDSGVRLAEAKGQLLGGVRDAGLENNTSTVSWGKLLKKAECVCVCCSHHDVSSVLCTPATRPTAWLCSLQRFTKTI